MSKKINLLLVLSIVLGLLGGCQLAKEEEKEAIEAIEAKEDKFVGVFITYREDGVYKDINGDADENGKTYAKLVSYEEDGIIFHDYVFENCDGIPFFHAVVKKEATGMEDYRTSVAGEGLVDTHVVFKSSVNEDINTGKTETVETAILNSNLYFTKDVIVYLNSVYQEEDGDVYFVKEGIGRMIGEGVSSNAFINKDEENATQVDINIKRVTNIKQTSYIVMNSEDEIIERAKFDLDDLPEKIDLSSEAEYMLIKTEYEDGKYSIETYTEIDNSASILTKGNDLLLMETVLGLEWAE